MLLRIHHGFHPSTSEKKKKSVFDSHCNRKQPNKQLKPTIVGETAKWVLLQQHWRSLDRRFRSTGPLLFLFIYRIKARTIELQFSFFRERKRKKNKNKKKNGQGERSQIRNLHTNKRPSKNSDMKFVNIRSLFILCFFFTSLSFPFL